MSLVFVIAVFDAENLDKSLLHPTPFSASTFLHY